MDTGGYSEMISTVHYWQADFRKIALSLKKRAVQKRWDSRSEHALERDAFVSMFAARKALESRLLDRSLDKLSITVTSYPKIPGTPLPQSSTDFPKLYDLYSGSSEQLTLRALANQFIHSIIFAPFMSFRYWARGLLLFF